MPGTALLLLVLLFCGLAVVIIPRWRVPLFSASSSETDIADQPSHSQPHRHLWAQVDIATLARYLAQPPGFRRHPSYYSDKYLTRSLATNDTYGAWTLRDEHQAQRPDDSFYAQYPHRDVPWEDFPHETAWQKDSMYLPIFLQEGIALAERGLELILTEYGRGRDTDGRSFEERIQILGPNQSVSLQGQSYKGLIRRILHAIVTQDTFVFAMAGHSAAAGHGNHFQQSYTHAYGKIMEPVLARLGVHASSRNFGFGGLGTIQTAMGAGDLMGRDVDVLVWDSGMTEKGAAIGVLGVQAALAGDRIPLFLADDQYVEELNVGADMDTGVANGGDSLKPPQIITSVEQFRSLPWAAQCISAMDKDLMPLCKGQEYRGVCWIDRSHFEWQELNMSYTPPNTEQMEPGGRASWHPGERVHQVKGRALAGLVLYAIRDALLLWKNSENLVLQDADWHVTDYYANIRTKLTTTFRETATGYCTEVGIPAQFCQVPIQARTEFTPRSDPARYNLRALIKGINSPLGPVKSDYDPPDVYNPMLHPPQGSPDVLSCLESGVEFAPNLGRIRRYQQLSLTNPSVNKGGSSVEPRIKPGRGWEDEKRPGKDMCDGEYDSWCNKGQPANACLLTCHNDGRGALNFDGLSGWGIFEIPEVRHGLIVIKVHDWLPPNAVQETNNWTTENNEVSTGQRMLTRHTDRMLKQKPVPACSEFRFEFAIDGKVTSWTWQDWSENMIQVQRVVQVAVLLNDSGYSGDRGRNVEIAMRLTGCQREKAFGLTHIYWA